MADEEAAGPAPIDDSGSETIVGPLEGSLRSDYSQVDYKKVPIGMPNCRYARKLLPSPRERT